MENNKLEEENEEYFGSAETAGSDLIIEFENKKKSAYQCTQADGQELSLILSVGQQKAYCSLRLYPICATLSYNKGGGV